MTALDIKEQYRSRVYAFLYGKREPHVPAMSPHHSCFSKERTEDLCTWWKKVLKDLRSDPMATSHYLDWTAKLALLTKLQERYQCGWDDARLTALDFSYSDLRPSGIYNKLVAAGRMRLMVDEAAVRTAVTHAPTTTRAWLRGALVESSVQPSSQHRGTVSPSPVPTMACIRCGLAIRSHWERRTAPLLWTMKTTPRRS